MLSWTVCNFTGLSLRAEPWNMLIGEVPEKQFVGRQKLNSWFPSQWQTIFKGMVTVTIDTLTPFALGSLVSRRTISLGGHSRPSTCVIKLRFSGLFRAVLPPDDRWPDGGLTMSEILPKTGLVTILASRSTKAARSLKSTGLDCNSLISLAVRRHFSLKLLGSLSSNLWMFPGWST